MPQQHAAGHFRCRVRSESGIEFADLELNRVVIAVRRWRQQGFH
jgi:hypothetical protein